MLDAEYQAALFNFLNALFTQSVHLGLKAAYAELARGSYDIMKAAGLLPQDSPQRSEAVGECLGSIVRPVKLDSKRRLAASDFSGCVEGGILFVNNMSLLSLVGRGSMPGLPLLPLLYLLIYANERVSTNIYSLCIRGTDSYTLWHPAAAEEAVSRAEQAAAVLHDQEAFQTQLAQLVRLAGTLQQLGLVAQAPAAAMTQQPAGAVPGVLQQPRLVVQQPAASVRMPAVS